MEPIKCPGGGLCVPGTEECYRIIALGLCDGEPLKREVNCKATGGPCQPGSEECYYVITIGLCDGPRRKRGERGQKAAAIGVGFHRESPTNITLKRFTLGGCSQRFEATSPAFPILYDLNKINPPPVLVGVRCHGLDPFIQILKPLPDIPLHSGEDIDFEARAFDVEGADVTGDYSWSWKTSQNPSGIGSHAAFKAKLASGPHTIEARAKKPGAGKSWPAEVERYVEE